MDEKWNAKDLGINRVGVAPAALLAEGVTVVGGQDDHARIVKAAGFEKTDEPAEATVYAAQARGVGRIEAAIILRVDGLGALAIDHRNVDVLRLCVEEHGTGWGLLDFSLRLFEGRAQVVVHVGAVFVHLDQAWEGRYDGLQDDVPADEGLVLVHFEKLLQCIHGGEGGHILLVEHHSADPDRWLRQPGCAVTGESILHNDAILSELHDVGREVDRPVVGREIIAAQAVDDDQKNIRLPAGRGRQLVHQIDGYRLYLERPGDIGALGQEAVEAAVTRRRS